MFTLCYTIVQSGQRKIIITVRRIQAEDEILRLVVGCTLRNGT